MHHDHMFPITPDHLKNSDGTYPKGSVYGGMTKREYFALHILSTLVPLADPKKPINFEELSTKAVAVADILLDKLEHAK